MAIICLKGVLGAYYGPDELIDNGSLLLGVAETNKLALTNISFSTRKDRVCTHTYNGVSGSTTSNLKRIEYILTRRTHRIMVQ